MFAQILSQSITNIVVVASVRIVVTPQTRHSRLSHVPQVRVKAPLRARSRVRLREHSPRGQVYECATCECVLHKPTKELFLYKERIFFISFPCETFFLHHISCIHTWLIYEQYPILNNLYP